MKKIYIQCGEEHDCVNRDCLKCPIKKEFKHLELTYAELSVIENFGICDLETLIKEKPKKLDLMQKIMINITRKVYKNINTLGNKKLRGIKNPD
jgi:hypothetical protein